MCKASPDSCRPHEKHFLMSGPKSLVHTPGTCFLEDWTTPGSLYKLCDFRAMQEDSQPAQIPKGRLVISIQQATQSAQH